jgi:hypothetical protein
LARVEVDVDQGAGGLARACIVVVEVPLVVFGHHSDGADIGLCTEPTHEADRTLYEKGPRDPVESERSTSTFAHNGHDPSMGPCERPMHHIVLGRDGAQCQRV